MKKRKLEMETLEELKNALNRTKEDLVVSLEAENQILLSCDLVINAMESNLEYNDSLNFHFAHSQILTWILVDEASYETLKNLGLNTFPNLSFLRAYLLKRSIGGAKGSFGGKNISG